MTPSAVQTRVIARILCGAGYAVVPFSPSENERGDGVPRGATEVFALWAEARLAIGALATRRST
jgi:hypothetical protein